MDVFGAPPRLSSFSAANSIRSPVSARLKIYIDPTYIYIYIYILCVRQAQETGLCAPLAAAPVKEKRLLQLWTSISVCFDSSYEFKHIYIYIYIYVHTCIYIYIYIYVYIYIYIYMYMYMHMHMHRYILTNLDVWTNLFTILVWICIYAYMHTCIHAYMHYIYIYAYVYLVPSL